MRTNPWWIFMACTTAQSVVLIALLLVCSVSAQPRNLPARIDSIAQVALDDGPIAGFSIAVIKEGKVLHAEGYGLSDIESGTPATAETVYNMASVAKIIAAAAVLRLVDAGKLSLDDDLTTLLPDFPNPEQGRGITLHQLLNHTSGLNDYVAADVERWKQTGEPLEPAFVLDYVRDRPLDFEPGTHWIYSNTGFYLAGLIVERVTGRPWGEVVLEDVARLLGLESVVLCDEVGDLRTTGYDVTDRGFVPSQEDAEQGVRGDAGLCATVLDLARLPGALMISELLSEASLHELLRPTMLANGVRVDYGLGVARGSLDGHPIWGHLGGNTSSYVATLAHYPDDDVTIAVLVNSRFGDVGALIVEAEVARAVLSLGTPTLADQALSTDALHAYLGTYVGDRAKYRYHIVADGERLAWVWADDSSATRALRYQGNHTFGRADWPMDRFLFHIVGDQALAYSVYYNGIFDGFYRRTDP